MHAMVLEAVEPYIKPGVKILDIGSGTGILSVCFAKLLKDQGTVYAVDHMQEVIEYS